MSTPAPIFSQPTLRLFVLLTVLWALIYLPGLGSRELQREEGRRILPGLTMLETGDWIFPQLGGVPYRRKPPLVNWLIAASVKLTGSRSEWAARLPSVLAMLALALTVLALGTGGAWMNAETALVAAIFTLTTVGVWDKGRLAEIEPVYLALSGVATLLWLKWWLERRSPWLLWLVPFVGLGLGLLAKAPLHLLFFYSIALCVLGHSREWRVLLQPAHLVGLLLAAGIGAAWAVPYLRGESAAAEVWGAQFLGRMTGATDWEGWATNIPRGLLDQLPWLLLAPLLWRPGLEALGERTHALFRGTRLAVLLCFFGLLLVPGSLPRYTLPLLAPFACLLALAVADHRLPPLAQALRAWWRANSVLALVLMALAVGGPIAVAVAEYRGQLTLADSPGVLQSRAGGSLLSASGALVLAGAVWLGRTRLARPALLAVASAVLFGAGTLIYAAAIVPFQSQTDRLRPVAVEINDAVPVGTPLYVYDPDYQPVLFYLRGPLVYARGQEEIPAGAWWVLGRDERRERFLRNRPEYEVAAAFPKCKPSPLVLFRLRGEHVPPPKEHLIPSLSPQMKPDAPPAPPPASTSSHP